MPLINVRDAVFSSSDEEEEETAFLSSGDAEEEEEQLTPENVDKTPPTPEQTNATTTNSLIQSLQSPLLVNTSAPIVAELLATTDFSPLSVELQQAMAGDQVAMSVLTECFSNQERKSSIAQYGRFWKRWADFCLARQWDNLFPPRDNDSHKREVFDARFGIFACHEYSKAKNGGRNKKTRANTPETFSQIFQGIDHIVTKIFNRQKMDIPLVKSLNTSYRLKYSRPTKKARPLLGIHIQKLVKAEAMLDQDWFTCVVDVVIIAWMSAGRWSCMDNINMEKSTSDVDDTMGINPDPKEKYWLLWWNNRKNQNGLTCCELPIVRDKRFDPRTRFMSMLTRYKRTKKLIPRFTKVQNKNLWNADTSPEKSCTYDSFLRMFRAAMKIAGLDNVCDVTDTAMLMEWSLHAFRRGFVTEVRGRGGKHSVYIETIARHGGWSYESTETILGYNSVTTTDHVNMVLPAILKALGQEEEPTTADETVERRRSKRRRVNV
jgi:hypothetical protein|tara:strand:- start:80 stop:1552 length:1473 start_codon:yes stop_codon:yes gene_type:complete